jgi:DNA-directed RNA polymerase II subunit RPB2
MERDCMITHGVAEFLKERLFRCSDPFKFPLCLSCNQIATTQTECKACDTDKVVSVNFPFASKLLSQQLNAMSIKTCFKVKDVFNDS